MNALDNWRNRPIQVRVLDRCDLCGELKENVHKRVSAWPNIAAVCCAGCFADAIAECSALGAYQCRSAAATS